MTFEVTIARGEGQSLNEILIDVIASASYYGIRDISAVGEEDIITFYHNGHMPIGEYAYLSGRYKPNLSVSIEE